MKEIIEKDWVEDKLKKNKIALLRKNHRCISACQHEIQQFKGIWKFWGKCSKQSTQGGGGWNFKFEDFRTKRYQTVRTLEWHLEK